MHAEPDCIICYHCADCAEADDAECFSLDFGTDKLAFSFFGEIGYFVTLAGKAFDPGCGLDERAAGK
jgi:hypothetical protein